MFKESEIAFIMLYLNLGSGVSSHCPSGSDLSKAKQIHEIPYFQRSSQSEFFGIHHVFYSLKDVAKYLGLEDYDMSDKKQFNNKLGKEVIQKLCEQVNPGLECLGEKEVVGLRNFSELCSTSRLYVDVLVYFKELLVLVVEIQSSPMSITETKAAIDGANVLRSVRSRDKDITKVTVFAIPNVQGDPGACILEIQVEWNHFKFMTTLKRYETIPGGVDAIKTHLRGQRYKMSLSSPDFFYSIECRLL